MIQEFSVSDREGWNNALEGVNHSIYQKWWYCNALQYTYKSSIQLAVIQTKNSSAVICFCKRSKDGNNYDLYSPYGFGGIVVHNVNQELIETIHDWMIQKDYVTAYLMGDPVKNKIDSHFEYARSSYTLDLLKSEDDLLARMHSNHRYEIRKSLKDEELELSFNKEQLKEPLIDLYFETLERVGASAVYYFDRETLDGLIESDAAILVGLKRKGEVLAALLVLYSDEQAEYFINATNAEGRSHTRLLLWEAIKELKMCGCHTLNLGGGAKEGDPLDAFKRRFGGEQIQIPVFKVVANKPIFESLCEEYLTDVETNYFPPYWSIPS